MPVISNNIFGAYQTATLEALTIPVSYTDVSAVDPIVGQVFTTQQQIDDFLSDNSAVSFKHLKAIWDALPVFIQHTITFSLATGVHRPRPIDTATAWALTNKIFSPIAGKVVVTGIAPASYIPIHGSLVGLNITGVQTGSGDPWLDFAGTPFLGFNLKGSMAVLSTGQTVMIHDHTDSRLFVNNALSPNPTGGTATVARPATILRNSIDDVATLAASTFDLNSKNYGEANFFGGRFELTDVLVDPFGGAGTGMNLSGAQCAITRCIMDQLSMIAAFGKTPNGNSFSISNRSLAIFNTCSHLNTIPAGAGCDLLVFIQDGGVSFQFCYLQGSEDGMDAYALGGLNSVTIFSSVFESIGVSGVAPAALRLNNGMRLDLFEPTASSKRNEFRGQAANVPSIYMTTGSLMSRPEFHACIFRDNGGAAVRMGDRASMDISDSTVGLLDGTGNTDFGFRIDGPQANVRLNSGTTVAGTAGNVRLADGSVVTYASLTPGDYHSDVALNLLSKV